MSAARVAPAQLHGGTWNMERDKPRQARARQVLAIMDSYRLDFLMLQESSDYLAAIRSLCTATGKRYVLCAGTGRGAGNTAILVRADLRRSTTVTVGMTSKGWRTVRGGMTPPKHLVAVKLNGWLTVAAGHYPPSVRFLRRRMFGPAARRRAFKEHSTRLQLWLRQRTSGAVVVACDWNATPAARGNYTPHWVARLAHGHLAAPHKGTHGRRVLDYPLVRNVGAVSTPVVRGKYGSDHSLVTFTITEDA